jgi:hypothetical protein
VSIVRKEKWNVQQKVVFLPRNFVLLVMTARNGTELNENYGFPFKLMMEEAAATVPFPKT